MGARWSPRRLTQHQVRGDCAGSRGGAIGPENETSSWQPSRRIFPSSLRSWPYRGRAGSAPATRPGPRGDARTGIGGAPAMATAKQDVRRRAHGQGTERAERCARFNGPGDAWSRGLGRKARRRQSARTTRGFPSARAAATTFSHVTQRDGAPQRCPLPPQRQRDHEAPRVRRPMRRRVRSGCMATMRSPPHWPIPRGGCAGCC